MKERPPGEHEKLEQARQEAEIARLNEPQPSHRVDKKDPPVIWIKELGYDSFIGVCGDRLLPPKELLFFIDMQDRNSFNATDEAVREAIFRFREMARTLELYLVNNRNNTTTDWIDPDKMSYEEQWKKRGFEVRFAEELEPRAYAIRCTRCEWKSVAPTVQGADAVIREHTCGPAEK